MVFLNQFYLVHAKKDVLNSQGRVADITQLRSAKLRAVVREWGFFVLFYYYYSDDMSELYYICLAKLHISMVPKEVLTAAPEKVSP